ncbi:MAG: hypothetical protein A2X36_16230 [Elusimicrobia bacterium GWA2_69_24]|nr:MAG: hypothetical protein A2X36_16230 [Elusimicrobia bacterium GWA2_69_24]
MTKRRSPAIFLDRDGTVIHDRPGFYLKRPEQVRVYRAAPAGLRLLRRAGYRLVLVSNQSGIGRGFFDRAGLARIHRRLRLKLREQGAGLDAFYFCPHHPDDGCSCRKPAPALVRRAVRELGLTLKGSFLVGDKQSDLELGRRVGIPSILVKTGHGRAQLSRYGRGLKADHVAKDLLAAARWIVRQTAPALLLAAAFAARGAAQGVPAPISTATVAAPFDLVRGTLPVSALARPVSWFPEKLDFEVKWGLISMGFSDMAVEEIVDFNGRPAYHVVSKAWSGGFADTFYKVRDQNESWIDAEDFRSLGYSKKLREGSFFRDEWVLYDYPAKAWVSKRLNKSGEASFGSGEVPGPVQDVLSSLYYIRGKTLQIGDEVVIDVNTMENWPFVLKVIKKETIKVPAGKFNTILVEPFMRKEGIFIQKGKRLRVWVTDDERHYPVMMKVEIIFGNITAVLLRKPN